MIVPLPVTLAPPAPFPKVLSQSREEEFVAPGVHRATYHLVTVDGPLAITIVAVDPREPTIRIDSVVAHDRMTSQGETLSSMAKRTGAIAGVNADYFDIGATNQPLNLVVHAGVLERSPSKRIVLAIHRDRSVHFERASFSGTVTYDNQRVPLTTYNEWPPQGGAGVLTSAYGVRKDVPGVHVVSLVEDDGAHLTTSVGGNYRVAAIDAAPAPASAAIQAQLVFGPAALALAPLPAVGDLVTIESTLMPQLGDVAAAVGGGPLLVADGAIAVDPDTPAPEERDVRFPVSGAGASAGGALLLASVDGRQNNLSIGLTRPQFAALWLGLGAMDAMAFDSGGSSEIVARVLGDADVSVQGSPSDGEERAIADGVFIYSDAPVGPPSRLVVRPREIVALPGTDVPVTLALTDAAGHGLGVVHSTDGDVVHAGESSHVAIVRASGIAANVPVRIVARPATLALVADVRDPDPGVLVRLDVKAADAQGRPIFLGDRVRFTATHGTFVAAGVLRAPAHDADVVAIVGDMRATLHVPVGRRRVPLAFFDSTHFHAWQFATSPPGNRGSVDFSGGVLQLTYDFTAGTRAAYANASFMIPGEPQTFSVDVLGDGSGAGIRAAFLNRFGERRALTLAKSIDWKGWQTVTIPLPDDLNPPVRLVSLYAFDGLGGIATHRAGALSFRNPSATIAGTP